ncbi:hypothetical protein [Flavobacterium psychrotolerans]|uniref:Uncharacterized protein n=1 Tax=Flavobacterium psychrotolerans TaxID=2169410 RepID=A0A2U1JGS4_9FLAO|nr:hypothetical protein [Flavobacterium psychrotolerans]PWA04204.1 hypothetical protein DB895_11945 [Flavobacterium psychrotolerans]
MKSDTPKQLMNQLMKNLLFRKFTDLMAGRIILLLVFTFCSETISAQGTRLRNDMSEIVDVKTFISSLKTPDVRSRITFSKSQNLEDLLYKIQPAIYFNYGEAKTYGEKPKSFFTDFRSLNRINNSNLLINNIEIVTIKINNDLELNSKIDLSVFSNFKNLKYIFILSEITTTAQIITNMIRNYDEKYSIFYKIDKGDNNQ